MSTQSSIKIVGMYVFTYRETIKIQSENTEQAEERLSRVTRGASGRDRTNSGDTELIPMASQPFG